MNPSVQIRLIFVFIFVTSIVSLWATEIPFSAANTVTSSFTQVRSVMAADIDGDGDLDLLGAADSTGEDSLRWWENTAGDGTAWTERIIVDAGLETHNYRGISAADIDGDGDIDVLSTEMQTRDLTWWENTAGNGTAWLEHKIDNNYNGVRDVFVIDVDGDGDLDAVAPAFTRDDVAWFENTTPLVTPWPKHDLNTNFDGARRVHAADLDGDGDTDILAVATNADRVTWWENNGTGMGWPEHDIDTAFDGARDVFAADIDGDGDNDVLGAAGLDDIVVWWENTNGVGTAWSEHSIDANFNNASELMAADMDCDGDLDVVGVAAIDDDVTWYENSNGLGTTWVERTIDANFDNAHGVDVGDLDGDGDLDVIGAALLDNTISWYENQTIHRSALYVEKTTLQTNFDTAHSVQAADINGDGELDLVGAARLDNEISWWRNQGSASSFIKTVITTAFTSVRTIATGDIDGDGAIDIVGAADGTNSIEWWDNTAGDGSAWTQRTVEATFSGARFVSLADVDEDGDLDVLGAALVGDEMAWFENTAGDGTAWTKHSIVTGLNGSRAIMPADIDGDGDLDAVGVAFLRDQVAWWSNLSGDGMTWSATNLLHAPPPFRIDGARRVFPADLDGDGDQDVLATVTNEDRIAWFENSAGNGTAWTQRDINSTPFVGARDVYAVDLDRDGDLDVIGASGGSATDDADDVDKPVDVPGDGSAMTWFENIDGTGLIWKEHIFDTAFGIATAAVPADLDGDGDLDIAGVAAKDNDIAWWKNRGGQFALATVDTSPAMIGPSMTFAAMTIDLLHRGRVGDHEVELTTLELQFEETSGDPLTTTEANSLIENLFVYLDDGGGAMPGVFDLADTLVTTVASLTLDGSGVQSVAFTDGDPNVSIPFAGSKTFFVVLESAATGPAVDSLRLTHITQASSTADDRAFDIPLLLEFALNTSTIVIDTSTVPVELFEFSID